MYVAVGGAAVTVLSVICPPPSACMQVDVFLTQALADKLFLLQVR